MPQPSRWLQNIAFLGLSLWAPAVVEARRCTFYVDSFGSRRRRCTGLLPGVIAAVVIGILVLLAFASLAMLLARRRKRTALQHSTNQPPPMMSQQSAYPPPNFPPPGQQSGGMEYGNTYGRSQYDKNDQHAHNIQMPPTAFNNR